VLINVNDELAKAGLQLYRTETLSRSPPLKSFRSAVVKNL
jgi:hypothetical protein